MNRKILSFICLSAIILGSALSAMGAGFQSVGYLANSMGGAGVAYSGGSNAAYYNPALLAVHKYGVEVSLTPRAGFREHNMADHVDALANLDIQETLDQLKLVQFDTASLINSAINGGTIDTTSSPGLESARQKLQTIQNELRGLSTGNALELMPGATLGVQVRSFGTGIFGLSDFGASVVVDTQRLGIIIPVTANGNQYYVEYDPVHNTFTARNLAYYNANSLQYALDHQTTTIAMKGVAYAEIPLAYGYQLKTAGGNLNIGGSFKIMTGRTYKVDKAIGTESGDILKDINDKKKNSTTFGLDAGVLFNPDKLESLSLGLVVKNFNNPKFDYFDGTQMEIKPQVRFGASFTTLLDRLTFAMDYDVTKNESLIPGLKEQYLGGGVDFHPFSWLSIRGGAMKNLKNSEEGVVPTFGLGFGAKWFQLDVSAEYSNKKGSYDGKKYPRYGSVQASFISRWF
jgi:hypothetical protein